MSVGVRYVFSTGAFAWALGWALALAPGCSLPAGFTCSSQIQCDGGVCVTGGCAFPSGDCDSGLRYGEFAPPHLAGACVPDDSLASESGTGGESETATETSASGSGPTTFTTSGDGDGDPSTSGDGDGDGDPSTSGGDGDPSTSGGDGDPSTSGDGDGDPALPIPDTALAHYSFDDILGATVVDATANGHDATMDNNQPQAPGVVGQGLSFANLDRVIVPPEVLAGQSAFTVEFYMQVGQMSGLRQFLIYYGSLEGTPPSLSVYVEYDLAPTNTMRFVWSVPPAVGAIGTSSIGQGQWRHVAVTSGPSGMRLYVDHFLDHEVANNPGAPGYPWIQIGGVPNGFGSFIGVIDEVRFSAGELEVGAMMPVP